MLAPRQTAREDGQSISDGSSYDSAYLKYSDYLRRKIHANLDIEFSRVQDTITQLLKTQDEKFTFDYGAYNKIIFTLTNVRKVEISKSIVVKSIVCTERSVFH